METIFVILFVIFILGMIKATVWTSISENIHDGIFDRMWTTFAKRILRRKRKRV